MPNFEVFTKRLVPLSQAPFVTVQRKGILSLSASAYEAMGRPDFVEMLYDSDERIIGLRAVDVTIEHAYPVRKSGDSNFLVSGIAFAKYYGIETSVATRYPAFLDGDVLCVDLKTGGTEVTGPRAKQRDPIENYDGAALPQG